MTQTPPWVTADRVRPWRLSAVALAVTAIGTLLGTLLAWLHYQSGTHCRDGWPALVAVSYLILIIPPVAGVTLAHIGLHRARAADRRSPMPGVGIAAVVLGWSVLVVVAGVAGPFALMMILFTNGLPC